MVTPLAHHNLDGEMTTHERFHRASMTKGCAQFKLMMDRVWTTLTNLSPLVEPSGFYVIEDVVPDSLMSRETQRVLDIVGDAGVFFAELKNNLCVVHKVSLQCCRERASEALLLFLSHNVNEAAPFLPSRTTLPLHSS